MTDLIKISELAARAGVEKSTIQHYIREGLIPTPEARPHRNMHYYDADLVERIKLIKDLQTRRNVPLARIREMLSDDQLADEQGIEKIRSYLYSSPAALDLACKPVCVIDRGERDGKEVIALDVRGSSRRSAGHRGDLRSDRRRDRTRARRCDARASASRTGSCSKSSTCTRCAS